MDGDFLTLLIKMLFSLVFIVLLIYISVKLGGNSMNKLQNGRFIRIVERVSVSKDNSFLIVKVGDKNYLAASAHGRLEMIRPLEPDEEQKLEAMGSTMKLTSLSDLYTNFKRKGRLK